MRPLLLLAALLVLAAPGALAQDTRPLASDELEVLRGVCYRINTQLLAKPEDFQANILREVRIAGAHLSDESIDVVRRHLENDLTLRGAMAELLTVRSSWRQRPTDLFLFWWDPRQSGADGLPSRAPTREEVEQLEAWARGAATRLGVEVPTQMPYRVNKAATGARTWPRSDLRWGVETNRLDDRRAVAEVLVLELTDSPYLVEPMALQLAECDGDADCRERLLDRARESASRGGYVPILQGLGAEAVGDVSDPAVASGLLVLDLIQRERSPAALTELLRAIRRGISQAEARDAIRRILRLTPARLDQDVQRGLREWSQAGSRTGPR